MAIHSSNLRLSPVLSLSLLCVVVGVSAPLASSGHVSLFGVHAKLLVEHMMQAAAEQTSLCPHSSVLPFPRSHVPSAYSIISK